MRWTLLILLLCTRSLLGAPTVAIDATTPGELHLGLYLDILEDSAGGLTLQDVSSEKYAPQWVKNQEEAPNKGITSSAYWTRIHFNNLLPEKQLLMLELGYPHHDSLEFYLIDSQGSSIKKTCGRDFKFSTREIAYRNCVFPFSMQPGTYAVYIRSKSEGSMQLPLILWQPNAFAKAKITESFGLAIYYGIMLVMVVYNLFLFLSTRKTNYLFYVMYITFFGIWAMSLNGVAFQYLWPEWTWWGKVSVVFLIAGAQFWAFIFFRQFLNLKTNSPIMDKLLFILEYGSLTIAILSLFLPYRICVKADNMALASALPISFWAGIVCLKNGYRPARFFVLAFSLFIWGGVTMALRVLGFVPAVFFTEFALQIGSASEVILLSLALADWIKYEQKLAQNKIENLNDGLRVRVTEIEQLNKEILAKEQERDLFFNNISHELRTPLNGIIGFVELLASEPYEIISTQAKKHVVKIGSLAGALKEQVNTILDLAKSRVGHLELKVSRFSLNELLQQCDDLAGGLALKFRDSSFSITSSWEKSSNPSFIGDANKVLTIIRNLLGNAFKFNLPGHPNTIRLQVTLQDGRLIILVTDTGVGIPQDQQSLIFEEFKQLQADARRSFEGTGLGLTMVRDLVKLMNGTIKLTSTLGQGSSFEITLIEQSEVKITTEASFDNTMIKLTSEKDIGDAKAVAKGEEPTNVPKSTGHILIVDDNAINCEVIEHILIKQGYKATSTYSGRGALQELRNHRPDLVLLDLMMPEMSGEDVLREMKHDDLLKDIPVILLTARASQEDRIAGLGLGADDYLAKPIISGELVLRIHNLLARLELARLLESTVYDQKMSQLGEMMSDLAHELRNINTATSSIVDILKPKISLLLGHFKLPEPGWSSIINNLIEAKKVPLENSRDFQILDTIPTGIDNTAPLRRIAATISDTLCETNHFNPVWQAILSSKDSDMLIQLDGCLDIVTNLLRFARSGIRTNELVRNVLAYSRQTGQDDKVKIDEVVDKVLAFLHYRLGKANIALKTQLDDRSMVSANGSDIQQILVNLIVNAQDALSELKKPDRYVCIRTHVKDDKILLEVADNGTGIKPEHIEHIFDAGFTTKGSAGNGRGLAIAKRLMLKNRGDISVKRADNETIFTLELKKAA